MYVQVFSDVFPFTQEDYDWARRRPAPDRVPLPRAGDEVLFRPEEMGRIFHADVVEDPNLENLEDPNIWYWQRNPLDGQRVLARAWDSWPMVKLRVYLPGGPQTGESQEARLPGASGWLPLDWQERQARLARFQGRW